MGSSGEEAMTFAARDHNRSKRIEGRRSTDSNSAPVSRGEARHNPIWQSLATRPGAIQAKLTVSQVDDPYEREADRVADQVTRMPDPQASGDALSVTPVTSYRAQRKCAECREEDEEGRLQRKESSAAEAPGTVPPMVHEALNSPGQPLDAATRAYAEPRFGYDFSRVRIHTDAQAAESARAMNAAAYTVGSDVMFDRGQHAPETVEGRNLLAHELTHVVQQSNGDVAHVQCKSYAEEINEALDEPYADRFTAPVALDRIQSLSAVDFNDTLQAMVSAGTMFDLAYNLSEQDRERFLSLLANRGTAEVQSDVIAAVPFFHENYATQLSVLGRKFVPTLGDPIAPPSQSLKAQLISSNPSAPFTGAGARGTRPDESASGLAEGEPFGMASVYNDLQALYVLWGRAEEMYGEDNWRRITFSQRMPGFEMFYDWSNPLKTPDSWLANLSQSERRDQVAVLFGQEIATGYPSAYGANIPQRIQVVRAAAEKHNLEPELVAAIILAEQRDQSLREDVADWYSGGSLGLGQIQPKTAKDYRLFEDLISYSPLYTEELAFNRSKIITTTTNTPGPLDSEIPYLLASDEFNIFAVAKYLRVLADYAAELDINSESLKNTRDEYKSIDLHLYSLHSSSWTDDHIRLIASEYTSKPFDDDLRPLWGEFVLEAYKDVKGSDYFNY
jgi:hypothetical protein